MNYFDFADKISESFISKIPGVGVVHALISRFIKWKHHLKSGQKWVEYDGVKLYLDTSDHVAYQIVTSGDYEPKVTEHIKNKLDVGDFGIDVGAHVGHHTATIRRCVGRGGKVWAFEPNPENANYINKTKIRHGWENVELFRKALSYRNSCNRLFVLDSDNSGHAVLADGARAVAHPEYKYDIEMMRLSALLNRRKIGKIDLLKIDVEGEEIAIINDIAPYLSRIKTIILEFHAPMLDEDDVRAAFRILDKRGDLTDLNNNPIGVSYILGETKNIIWQYN
jgi:FkbM family methyltransferase